MKTKLYPRTIKNHPARILAALTFVALFAFSSLAVFAQQEPATTATPAQETQEAQETPKIPNDQLDSLVAPIALYPDPLLSQVLVSSTYPLELVQLQQWLQKTGKMLNEKAIAEAVQKEDWDPSVQAMAVLPAVVGKMVENIKWTTDLGNAFLAQQGDVMQAVQRMRVKAKDAGKLKQKEYALEAKQYAQRIVSTPGKRDGLAWKNDDGTWGGPIGEGIAKALEQGYASRTEPYHGYFFKILKGQGPAAPLGKMDFVVNGLMIGGFALVAVPAEYRVTGVKTFMVSYTGIVHEKDLGPNSLEIVKKMELYNPDRTWRPTDASW